MEMGHCDKILCSEKGPGTDFFGGIHGEIQELDGDFDGYFDGKNQSRNG
jgi:hypothetical protein